MKLECYRKKYRSWNNFKQRSEISQVDNMIGSKPRHDESETVNVDGAKFQQPMKLNEIMIYTILSSMICDYKLGCQVGKCAQETSL